MSKYNEADIHDVDMLRDRLRDMKNLMNERNAQERARNPRGYQKAEEIFTSRPRKQTGVIDGNFLSLTFGTIIIILIIVSVYAFYSLYNAILKKFPSRHEEL